MPTSDSTLTSPVLTAALNSAPLLCLTIAWHPDPARIGQQSIVIDGDSMELSRFLPLFRQPGQAGAGLGHGGISRTPLRIARDRHDGVLLTPPDSRMVVEVNGQEIDGAHYLAPGQITAGVVLGLGRAVLLCLHWMRRLPQSGAVDGLIGVGGAAIELGMAIRQAAATDAAVLLLGETGTGKEVAAHAIHRLSRRAHAPLVSVNMAALNESLAAADLFGASKGAYTGAQAARGGLFAEARDATLFLDEIGNTPAAVQPMLLRVLETGEYRPLGASGDVRSTARLIAATDQDLYGGGFNPALLRRLESFVIRLPPLRARREDIGVLIAHLLATRHAEDGVAVQLPVALVSQLLNYDWPGNIRQLRHVLMRAVLALRMGETPDLRALADGVDEGGAAPERVAAAGAAAPVVRKKLGDLDEQAVLAALEDCGWQIQGAAQALGVSRPSMYKLIEAHPLIRRAEHIAQDELRVAWQACGGDLQACATRLRTPAEALRRHLRALAWLA